MSRVEATVAGFRRRLARGERQATAAILRAYGEAWREARVEIERLAQEIARRRAAGLPVTPGWLYQARRLDRLMAQLEALIAAAVRSAAPAIRDLYASILDTAVADARALLLASLPPPLAAIPDLPINVPALERVVALSEAGPLRELLDRTVPAASDAIRQALVQGVALGEGAAEISRRARRAAGIAPARALLIARTETMRAYRATLLETYRANPEIVAGWIWHARLDGRTCPFCWAMHGRRFPRDRAMPHHPGCRCVPIPATRSWTELGRRLGVDLAGVPETAPVITPGPVLFAALPPAQQRRILGPAKFAAYQDGALRLEDLAGVRRSRDWGATGYERSLAEIVGPARAVTYARAAREDHRG